MKVQRFPYIIYKQLLQISVFLDGSVIKNPPANAGDMGSIPGEDWEDPMEKEMATHSSIPSWEIPWTEMPHGLQSTGLQKTQRVN